VTLLGQGVGLGDPQRSLPTPNILWFCNLTKPQDGAEKASSKISLLTVSKANLHCHEGHSGDFWGEGNTRGLKGWCRASCQAWSCPANRVASQRSSSLVQPCCLSNHPEQGTRPKPRHRADPTSAQRTNINPRLVWALCLGLIPHREIFYVRQATCKCFYPGKWSLTTVFKLPSQFQTSQGTNSCDKAFANTHCWTGARATRTDIWRDKYANSLWKPLLLYETLISHHWGQAGTNNQNGPLLQWLFHACAPTSRQTVVPAFRGGFTTDLHFISSKLSQLFFPPFPTSALGHLHHGQERVHRDGGWRYPKTHFAQLKREDLDTGDAAASERQVHPLAGLRVAGTQSSVLPTDWRRGCSVGHSARQGCL